MLKRSLLSGFAATLFAIFMLTSCGNTQTITYFQDYLPGYTESVAQAKPITMQVGDRLSIVVSSRNPQLASLFNLQQGNTNRGGVTSSVSTPGGDNRSSLYTIDSKGDIDFPVLGTLHVAGKSREEIAAFIKEELIRQDLIKDPVVTVEFGGMHYSVLGEVNSPGQYDFENDRVTILDAISRAGDLTIYGLRDRVMLIRTENGQRKVYNLNLLSGQELTQSPAFYLKQNDVIYVDPNVTRAKQSTVNGNTLRSTAFWVSMASLAMSVTMFIKNW